ncbi:hypothetical protein ISN35_02185 [Xanthomonas translucens pv. undulosa]|uniref:hypothetical protein n=1 Tax=Xanthomonas campestris pv. translucens TaxID=343 RepID=UPI0019D57F81|nr:hypothetical protein [Xanthomonas translucens]QSQ42656.1 hypothetical protein ISN33_05635 [Xanthomonas translucens pv. translucens]QSQ49496.1 hypothetical protein ISN35_02185 [Xanthomonas translucens pv. undulosa]
MAELSGLGTRDSGLGTRHSTGSHACLHGRHAGRSMDCTFPRVPSPESRRP